MGKVWNAKLCLPNHILVSSGDWFKYHFWQLFFKADCLKIHFLLTLLFSLWIAKSDNSIVVEREREVLKLLKKINFSATNC